MSRRIIWSHTTSVLSLTLLVAIELLVAGVAAGWAIAGIFGLGDVAAYVLEGLGALLALYMVWSLFLSARKTEPFSE